MASTLFVSKNDHFFHLRFLTLNSLKAFLRRWDKPWVSATWENLEHAGHPATLLEPSYVHFHVNRIIYCEGRICCPFDLVA